MECFANKELWSNGPSPDSLYSFPGHNTLPKTGDQTRTLQPITTGTSVFGIRGKNFVILAADKLGSYGSLARYKDVSRIVEVNKKTLLGAGGDIADFQYIKEVIENKALEDHCHSDGYQFNPSSLHSWLTRVLYQRRTKMNPLWNTFVVGGLSPDGNTYLGCVDKIGTAFRDNVVATGYGAYLALPILRKHYREDMSVDDAGKLIMECARVLYYRDCRTINKYSIAVATAEGVKVEDDVRVDTNWNVASYVKGYE